MWMFIGILSFLSIFVFLVLALIAKFKKTGKTKKMLLISAGCFVLFIASVSFNTSGDDQVSKDADKPKQEKQQKVEKVSTKEKDVAKEAEKAKKKAEAAEAAKKKKAEQETPDYKLKQAVTKALGKESNREGNKITELTFDQATGNILVNFKGDENLTENMTITGVKLDIKDTLKAIKTTEVAFNNINIVVSYSMVDQYGNTEESKVIDLNYSKDTVDKINFDNFNTDNVYTIADTVNFIHPSFISKK